MVMILGMAFQSFGYGVFFLMIRRPPRSTQGRSSAASDVYKRQPLDIADAALRDRTRAWLADHEDAPAGLRRLVIEQLAVVETAVAAQEREGL